MTTLIIIVAAVVLYFLILALVLRFAGFLHDCDAQMRLMVGRKARRSSAYSFNR